MGGCGVTRRHRYRFVISRALRMRTCIAYSEAMNTTQPSTRRTLRVRWNVVEALRQIKDLESDSDLARAMGVNTSSVSRVINGRQQPGPRFIAGLCVALDAKMTDLFVVVEDAA